MMPFSLMRIPIADKNPIASKNRICFNLKDLESASKKARKAMKSVFWLHSVLTFMKDIKIEDSAQQKNQTSQEIRS